MICAPGDSRLRRAGGDPPFATALVSVLLVAVAALAAFGRGYVGYDGFYSLVWGRDLASGRMPSFDVPVAPTPHPLSILAGALLSPFGDAAPKAYQLLVLVAFAALGYAAFSLGSRLFSRPVGALFALVLLTRPLLVGEMLHASVDIPFLALVVWAAAVEARKPRSGSSVLVLLALAGLLRPEAWFLSAAYLVYRFPGSPRGERIRLSALALAGPLIWAAGDLAISGDPLHSLHGTRELAEELERPRSATTAPRVLPSYLVLVLEEPLAWGGAVGTVCVLWLFYQRALLPLAILFIGLGAFLVLGVAGLPLLVRYLLLPAVMLALFYAVAVFGWLHLARGTRLRRACAVVGALFAAALMVSVPSDLDSIRRAKQLAEFRRGVQRDLKAVATSRAGEAGGPPCAPIAVPNHRPVPLLAFWLDRTPRGFVQRQRTEPRGGTLITPAAKAVELNFLSDPKKPASLDAPPPETFERRGGNDSWALYQRC